MLKSAFIGAILAAALTTGALLLFLPTPETELPQPSEQATSAVPSTTAIAENSFAITNVQLFDGQTMQRNIDIVIRNGRIDQIGTDLSPLPDNFPVTDGSGKTLIPGLVDAHTHSWGSALVDALQFGITTNIDQFTIPSMLRSTIQARERDGNTKEARLFSAGMLATAPDGHGTQFGTPVEPISDPDQADAWVKKRIAEGSDFIKLVYHPYINYLPSMNRETAKAVIDAAHNNGIIAVAHISTLRGAQDLIEDGIDGLVHIFADTPATQEFIDIALEKEVFIVPTITIVGNVDGQQLGKSNADNEAIAPYLSSIQRQSLRQAFPTGGITGFDFQIGLDNIRTLHKAGVPIYAGSDAPNPGTAHGVTLHQEMALLVDAGFTPLEALKAGTSAPASAFSIPAGQLTKGDRADMVLLSADPSQDISATLSIETIYRNGFVIDRRGTEKVETNANIVTNSDLGTFETDLTTPEGFHWTTTMDDIAGGTSEATITRSEPGANGSKGALQVTAEVKAGFPFPWAGTALYMTQDFTSSYSIKKFNRWSFDMRGTPGTYRAMVFNAGFAGNPPTLTFQITEDWQRISFNLDDFPGIAKNAIYGIGIVAGPQLGQTVYEIDNVTIE